MAKRIQFRGGTTAQHSTFTGAIREITVDTDKDTLVVHDGTTVGGFPLARESIVTSGLAAKVDKNANIVAGTGTKVTYDKKGLVTGSTTLSASDIPSLDASKITTGTLSLDTTGSASKLNTARSIGISGDMTWSTSFNGSSNVTGVGTLANSGVTAGTYKSVTVDSKGRVTNGTNPTTLSGYGITDAFTKTETNTQISNAISGLVDAAPGTLDTLNELSAALGDDPNFATTTANAIAAKVAKVTSNDNAIVRFDGTTGDVQNSSVIIDDSGNLGIGVTPSAWYSSIKVNQIGAQTAIWNDNINGLTCIGKNTYKSGASTYNYIVGDYAQMYIQGSGSHQWYTAPLGTAGNAITWTNAMTLDASGNLLLGIVGGTGVIQANNAIYSWNNVSNFTYIVNQTVSGTAQVFGANVGGVINAAILSNGTYQSATNVYGSTSDIKLKENVVDTTPKLDKLMQVQVRNFNYIGQEEKQIGVIAQEIEQIFPSVVFETKDTKQVEVTKERIIPALEELKDDDGNITQEAKPETIEEYTEIETVETGETTKNVKYSVIYMMMLKGMQEMREEYIAEIKSLKDELAVLKGAK